MSDFCRVLERELLRLQWMTRQLKWFSPRPVFTPVGVHRPDLQTLLSFAGSTSAAKIVNQHACDHFCTVESLRIKAAKVCEKEGLSTDLDQKVFLDSLPTNGALCPQQSISRNRLIAAGE